MKKKSSGSCKSEPLAQAVNLCTTHGLLGLREFFMFFAGCSTVRVDVSHVGMKIFLSLH